MVQPKSCIVDSQRTEITLSKRRQRDHLKIDATTIQKSWEENQKNKNMVVYGPFEPVTLSKERIKALARIDDQKKVTSRVDSQVSILTKKHINHNNGEEFEEDGKIVDTEVKRRPSGFWRYVNGCFGGDSSKKQPIKPRAPRKISSNTVSLFLPP